MSFAPYAGRLRGRSLQATREAKASGAVRLQPAVRGGHAVFPMAQDVNKQLERARRSLEKNKLREAVGEYQAILDDVPSNQEALQALADIYTRLNEPALAVPYYAAHFDRLIEVGDAAKASAIFTRFLRSFPQ